MAGMPLRAISLTLAIFAPTVVLSFPASAAEQSTTGLSPQDRVDVKVLEWLPAKGEYKEWTAVGGQYAIASDGSVALPFAGSIDTSGRDTGEVSRLISKALQNNLSLPSAPDVRVEIVQRAPIYVLGGVETPGKVEFVPGLTAIEAISLAGGFYRTGGGQLRLERDVINAQGDLDAARESAARLTAKVARLEAETAGQTQVSVPQGQTGFSQEALAPFVKEEQGLLDVRKTALDSQIASLKSREALATEQSKTLDEKASNLQRQVELSRQQLGSVETLVGKGLTTTSRQFDLERTLADFQGQLLDVQSARLAANLEINAAQRDQVDTRTAFETEVATSLQSTREDLDKARIEMGRARMLIREATVVTPQMLTDSADSLGVKVHLFRSRTREDGSVETSEIDRNAPLRSGDTLQVQLDTGSAQENLSQAVSGTANPS